MVNPYRRPNWPLLDRSQPLCKDDDFHVDVDEKETLQKLEEGQDPVLTMSTRPACKLLKCMRYICRTCSSRCRSALQRALPPKIQAGTSCSFTQSSSLCCLCTWLQRKDAMPLQHLCKCKVRAALPENDALSHGIQKLPLPDIIKEYLDLMRD